LHRDGVTQQESRVGSINSGLEQDLVVPNEVEGVLVNESGKRAMHCEI
jgi:hypothetical protein